MLTAFQSFNVVAQHDSHVMKNDSKSMRAIAIVTMAFLPLATIAVRDHSFLKGLDNTNKGRAGNFRLPVFQFRCSKEEDSSRK